MRRLFYGFERVHDVPPFGDDDVRHVQPSHPPVQDV